MLTEPISSIPQRTEGWFQARLGKLTASRCKDALDRLKTGKPSAKCLDLIDTLITERITGQVTETFTNAAMQWGTDQEPYAKMAFESKFGVTIEDTGLIDHPSINWFAASPDGIVGPGLVEFKCPTSRTHLRTLRGGVVPEEHFPQLLAQLACTGAEYVDFASFDPRFPADYQLFVRRFAPAPGQVAEFEVSVVTFLAEVQAAEDALRGEFERF
jgi:putative phage-type endonuclease